MDGILDAFMGAASGYFDAAYNFMFKSSGVEALAVLATALAIVWAGYKLLYSAAPRQVVEETVKTAIWIVVSVSLVFHSDGYWHVIAPLIERTFEGIAGGFSTLSWGGDYIAAADGLLNGLRTAWQSIFELLLDGGILDFLKNFGSVIVILFFAFLLAAVCLTAIIFLIYYVVALKITLLLGGFSLILGAFQITRPIFNQWVKALIDYGIGVIVVGVVCGMSNVIFDTMLDDFIKNKLYTLDSLQDNLGVNMIIGCVGIAYMLYKSQEVKSSISAGIQSAMVNAANTANLSFSRRDKPHAPPAPPGGGGGGGTDASNAYSQLQGNGPQQQQKQ